MPPSSGTGRDGQPGAMATMAALTVLVVEDVPELSHLLAMTLELDGRFAPVASAASGSEAVANAERHRPDAIVLDVSIDGLDDGLDILPQLRELVPDARIIVFTAHGNQTQQERALASGASDYIVKGGNLESLLDSLAGTDAGGNNSLEPAN